MVVLNLLITEYMDGNGRYQIQPLFSSRESHNIRLYPMGRHDEMLGGRASALGQRPG